MHVIRLLPLIFACGLGAVTDTITKGPYTMFGQKFNTPDKALARQVEGTKQQLVEVVPGQYYGGSLLVTLPPDNVLMAPAFLTSSQDLDAEQKQFFRDRFRIDAELRVQAFIRSGLFDSVTLTRSISHWRYASDFGYRYVFVYGGVAGFTLLDMATNTETKVSILGTGMPTRSTARSARARRAGAAGPPEGPGRRVAGKGGRGARRRAAGGGGDKVQRADPPRLDLDAWPGSGRAWQPVAAHRGDLRDEKQAARVGRHAGRARRLQGAE